MVEGKAEEALTLYDDVLSRRATAYAIHANRGAALDVLGRWDDALAAFDTALELKEDYTEAHHNRGVVLAKLGRFEVALVSHVQATTLRPTFAEAFRGAADAAARLDKFEEAVEYATKVGQMLVCAGARPGEAANCRHGSSDQLPAAVSTNTGAGAGARVCRRPHRPWLRATEAQGLPGGR